MSDPQFKRAFGRFLQLVKPIPQVKHVVLFDDEHDLFTYIEKRDDDVCLAVFRAEDRLREEFPSLSVDFHIVYLEGRPLNEFVAPLPPLVFSR